MIKRFFKNYVWFWKESFSFMEGYNRMKITLGCMVKAPKFCVDMEKWHRVQDKEYAYANMDRSI